MSRGIFLQLSLHLKSFEENREDYPDFEVDETGETPAQDEEKKFPWAPIIAAGLALILLCLGLWFFLFRHRGNQTETPVNKTAAVESSLPADENPPAFDGTAVESAPSVEQSGEAGPPEDTVQLAGTAQTGDVAGNARPALIDSPPRASSPAPSRERQDAPVYSFKMPQTIPPEGIGYTIRWGDTLWDIAEVFYRNPWLYPRIVRYNNMENPNLIVSGTKITIPPRAR